MAETRKHRVTVRDDIDRAIFAALGEPVLPNPPGADGAEPAAADDAPAASEKPAAACFATGSVVGQFTFSGAAPKAAPPAPVADETHQG